MKEPEKCCCCSDENITSETIIIGPYICYCNKVTENDIASAILDKGAQSVEDVIQMTGAMVNSNCKVNNPKGTCCYPDIVQVFNKYKR